MGWDTMVRGYDPVGWAAAEAVVEEGLDAVRARIDAELPPEQRERWVAVELEDPLPRTLHVALVILLAAPGPGGFLMRSGAVPDLVAAASSRPALASAVGALAPFDPMLSDPDGDAEDQCHRGTPAHVAAIAAHADPMGLPALSTADLRSLVAAWQQITGRPGQPGAPLTDDHPAVVALGRSASEVTAILGLAAPAPPTGWRRFLPGGGGTRVSPSSPPDTALRLLVGRCRHLADAGHGLLWSYDDLIPSLARPPSGL